MALGKDEDSLPGSAPNGSISFEYGSGGRDISVLKADPGVAEGTSRAVATDAHLADIVDA